MENLIVYHGGTHDILTPDVSVGRPNLDFGPGFYVTDIYSQAKEWALKVGELRESTPVINRYELNRSQILKEARTLVFESYNKDWLEFVSQSRLGNRPWEGFDYIEGGVADDRVVNTIRLYMAGYISAEDALNRLQYFKPTNQICLLNQGLTDKYLKYIGSENITDHE